MNEKKIVLQEAQTGIETYMTEQQMAKLLGLDPSDEDYEHIIHGFFGFKGEEDD